MTTILGIDAAWTPTEPSGVALLTKTADRWRCVGLAPSYDAFIALADGTAVDWARGAFRGTRPDLPAVLAAARLMAGADVDLVALDMPVATLAVSTRRHADNAISAAFGARGCSTHSPSVLRPGAVGADITQQLIAAGYQLVTTSMGMAASRQFIEVYPHPALLALLQAPYRIQYKVQKSSRYWKGESVSARIRRLLTEFSRIDAALRTTIDDLPHVLPAAEPTSLSALKRYEDARDALVCGWVAMTFAGGRARAYGDATAAVWVPDSERTIRG